MGIILRIKAQKEQLVTQQTQLFGPAELNFDLFHGRQSTALATTKNPHGPIARLTNLITVLRVNNSFHSFVEISVLSICARSLSRARDRFRSPMDGMPLIAREGLHCWATLRANPLSILPPKSVSRVAVGADSAATMISIAHLAVIQLRHFSQYSAIF